MKVWWQSKTLWFNVITVAGLIIAHIVGSGLITDPKILALISEGVAIINIVLRFGTTTELKLK